MTAEIRDDPRLQPLLERIAKEETDLLSYVNAPLTLSLRPERLRIRRKHSWRRKHTPSVDAAIGAVRQMSPLATITRQSLKTNGTKRLALVCEVCEAA